MAHAIVRTDLMAATDVRGGESLVSFRYQPSGTKTEIDNGNVVLLDGLEDGEREIFVAVTPAANSDLKDIVLVANPEVMYDERIRNLDQYYNVAGKAVRGYHLHKNDIFSVTIDALAGNEEPEVGDIVELKAGTKLNVVDSLTASSTKVGEIIHIEAAGRYTYYAIQVG